MGFGGSGFLVVVVMAFYGLAFWLAWTLVMSVKGIHEELSMIRREWSRRLDEGGT